MYINRKISVDFVSHIRIFYFILHTLWAAPKGTIFKNDIIYIINIYIYIFLRLFIFKKY